MSELATAHRRGDLADVRRVTLPPSPGLHQTDTDPTVPGTRGRFAFDDAFLSHGAAPAIRVRGFRFGARPAEVAA